MPVPQFDPTRACPPIHPLRRQAGPHPTNACPHERESVGSVESAKPNQGTDIRPNSQGTGIQHHPAKTSRDPCSPLSHWERLSSLACNDIEGSPSLIIRPRPRVSDQRSANACPLVRSRQSLSLNPPIAEASGTTPHECLSPCDWEKSWGQTIDTAPSESPGIHPSRFSTGTGN